MSAKHLHSFEKISNALVIFSLLLMLLFPTGRAAAQSVSPVPATPLPLMDLLRQAAAPVYEQARQAVYSFLQRLSTDEIIPTREWMNFYGMRVMVDGQPAPAGTVIQVFNPRGVLSGQTVVSQPGQYGLLTAYADDPDTLEDEGMRPGDTASFGIDGQTAKTFGPDLPTWGENGDLKWVDLAIGGDIPPMSKVFLPVVASGGQHGLENPAPEAASPTNLVLPLIAGWNLISIPYQIDPADPAYTLASIAGLYSVVLGYDQGGLSYYPSLPPGMNTLKSIDAKRGYWVKMNAPGTLTVNGTRVADTTPISLSAGWNLVSYLPWGAQPLTTALSGIIGKYTVVLGYDRGALSFYPGLPPDQNTLNILDVYHGYWIKTTANVSLVYPGALKTATPLPTSTSVFILPKTPTPLPTLNATPTLAAAPKQVNPPAVISANTTWKSADGVYVINTPVTVNQGITLTIAAGTVIKFQKPSYYNTPGLVINGNLVANGTAAAPVVFTSFQDDSYGGDTNQDGQMSRPGAGDWGSITLAPTSTASSLKYVLIRYAGAPSLDISGSSPLVDHAVVEYGSGTGIVFENSAAPTLQNSTVRFSNRGVDIRTSSAPVLNNNTIERNHEYAIFMQSNTAPRFSGNHAASNGVNGVGVSGIIAPSVAWDSDLPYVIDGGLTINPGITLTLNPGAVIKFKDSGESLVINGSLQAVGAATSHIVFTSLKDDSAGGDTNNDGSATIPAPGNWKNIQFSSTSSNTHLQYVDVRYGGYSGVASVAISGSAPLIQNSTVSYSAWGGVSLSNVAMPTIEDSTVSASGGNGIDLATSSSPVLHNNGLVKNQGYALRMEATCSLDSSGNTASQNLYDGIGVYGAVPANTTWQAGLPYFLENGVTVNTGISLTILPGAVLKFLQGSSMTVNGALKAIGISGSPILFTSQQDPSIAAPSLASSASIDQMQMNTLTRGYWGSIQFSSTSSASMLDHVIVRYGGSNAKGSVVLNGSAPSISNSIIAFSSSSGLYVSGSSPALTNNVITSNASSGVYAEQFGSPTLQNNSIYANTQYGVYNGSSGITLSAANNWWGDSTGPTYSSNPTGKGDKVSDGVTFNPWLTSAPLPNAVEPPDPPVPPVVTNVSGVISAPTTWSLDNSPYVVTGSITVNVGVVLTIQPGVVVKFQPYTQLQVNGVLVAAGTTAQWIVFTSAKDDAYGGDANNDKGATRPAPGDWGGITFGAAASGSNLAYALVQYADTGVTVNGSSPTLSFSTMRFNSQTGLSVTGAGAPLVQNDTFRENTGVGVSLSGSSPTLQGNVFVNNGEAAVSMDGNSLPNNSASQAFYNQYNGILVSGTIGTRGGWHKDLPYLLEGDVTVDTGVVLTLEPGIVVKFISGSLVVNGGLVSNGTSASPIVFTSIHDDSVGGDTNNNGSQTWPNPGDWTSIHFMASSLGVSSLTYSRVSYGNLWITGSSPTIANDQIAYSAGDGLKVESLGAPSIHDNVFLKNTGSGLNLASSSAPQVQNNQFTGNLGPAVIMDAGCTPTFTGNTAANNRINGVQVSGEATATTTWQANLVYVLNYVTINSGVTITLTPGTIVKLQDGTGLTANGNLVAVGTSTSKITFTSIHDDSAGGDTNNDGGATHAGAGDWDTILYNASSTGSKLTYVNILYGGHNYWSVGPQIKLDSVSFTIQNSKILYSVWDNVEIDNASPTIQNSEIGNNSRYGIYLNTAHATISGVTIHDSGQAGIGGNSSNPAITGSTIKDSHTGIYLINTSTPFPTINNNTFANNTTEAAWIEPGALPTFGLNSFTGTVGNGVHVSDGTLVANATLYGKGVYVLDGLTVEQGVTLTVNPGAFIKSSSYGLLAIKGNLQAIGTAASPIFFTSYMDDAAGGDTNHDGAATGPAAGNWNAIYFAPTSGTSTIEQATIRYAGQYFYFEPVVNGYYTYYSGGGVNINNSAPTITNSTLSDNSSYGIYSQGGRSLIKGNTFKNQYDSIYAQDTSTLDVENNTISGSGTGVYADDSSTVTLVGNTFGANPVAADLNAANLPNVGANTATSRTGNYINVRAGEVGANASLYEGITYVFNQTITVNAGVVLTALPGSVTKLSGYCYYWCGPNVLLRGKLVAQGTSAKRVVFTSIADDPYGGDTNNDGSATRGAPGNWDGIYLSTSDSIIDYAVIRYGGSMQVDGSWYSGMLVLNGVSPTISNSEIGPGASAGIWVSNATPSIHDNKIWGNEYGIWSESGARPVIHQNQIQDNRSYGIYNADTTLVVDATDNSWGHDSGPSPVGAGNGVNYSDSYDSYGQLVRTYWVAFDPWNGKSHWIEQNLGLLKQWVAYVAEPVNTATGNYVYNYSDVMVPGRGLSLEFHRYYNSLSTYQGSLGYGWTFNYGMTVKEETDDVLVTREDGRIDKYLPDGSGGYTPPAGNYDLLSKVGGVFVLKLKDQTVYTFNSAGKLASIADRNSNTLILNYSGSNLGSATDASGRSLTFGYDSANRINLITDPTGRKVQLGYDEFSNLISVTDVLTGVVKIAYDSKHRLITITDQNNHIFVTNIYDDQGRVITQRDARLKDTHFSYDPYTKVTTVTDPNNHITTYYYDAELRLTSELNAAGYSMQYGYDSSSNLVRVTNRRGKSTLYEYDSMGNVKKITDAMSGETLMTFDAINDLLTKADPLGHTGTNEYDAKGNLVKTTDPEGGVTHFAYYPNGMLQSVTDPRAHITTYTYDTYGYPASTTNTLNQTSYEIYDIAGRKVSETDAAGNKTVYTYDKANHLASVTAPEGDQTQYTYDPVGNRLTVTDPLGHQTKYEYDQKDKLVKVTDAKGGVTEYGYDAVDNKVTEKNARGYTTTYNYDNLNRLVSVVDPKGYTASYGYDVDGNKKSETNPNGKTTNFTVDELNRVTQITDPNLFTTTYVYDKAGNRTRVMDPESNTTDFAYDKNNRLVKVTDAMSGVVTYSYDASGNRLSLTDANNHVTKFVYDKLNRLSSVEDPLHNVVSYAYDAAGNRSQVTNARSQVTQFTYDKDNRLKQTTYPGPVTVTYTYDTAGNRKQMVDSTGTSAYTYDELNRLLDATDGAGKKVSYTYDEVGNRKTVTYPGGKTVTYTYNESNRLVTVSDWLSRETNYTYDNAGNPTGIVNPNNTQTSLSYDGAGRLVGMIHSLTAGTTILSISYTLDKVGNRKQMVDSEGTTTYEYDKLYRLTLATYPDATSEAFQYDPMGNRIHLDSTSEGAVTYTYDAADHLTGTSTVKGTTTTPISFTWDADGNMLSKGSTSYQYDAANRLMNVTTPTLTSAFTYNGDGRRATKTVNSATTRYVFDVIGGLAAVLEEDNTAGATLYTYGSDLIAQTDPAGVQAYYHADGLGSTRLLTGGSGQTLTTYTYQAFGSLRSSTGSPQAEFTYAGEQVDETGLVYLRARYYDPQLGRFISKDKYPSLLSDNQTINRYVYAGNNPVRFIDPNGESWKDIAKWGLTAITIGALIVGGPVAGAIAVVAGAAAFFLWIDKENQYFDVIENSPNEVERKKAENAAKWGLIEQTVSVGLDIVSGGLSFGNKHISPNIPDPAKGINQFFEGFKVGLEQGYDWLMKPLIESSISRQQTPWVSYFSGGGGGGGGGGSWGGVGGGADGVPSISSRGAPVSNYTYLVQLLQQSGYNPAHPSPPPGGGK